MEFHWADYLVFLLLLVMTLVLALISMYTQRKDKSIRGYLLAGGDMNVVMVGASMLLSILNAVLLLGGTAEVHYRYLYIYIINIG